MTTSGLVSGPSAAQIKASQQQIAVRLINVPDGLKANNHTIRVEGQVIGRGPDKTLLLKTDYGEVSVQTKGAINAREGQRLQIDILPNGAKDTVIRPSSNTIEIKQQENPSLLRTVADKLVSLARSADLSKSTLTQTQTIVRDTKILTKTADLLAGTSVRLSPLANNTVLSSVSPALNTQLALSVFQIPQTVQTAFTGPFSFQVNAQTVLVQSVLGLSSQPFSAPNGPAGLVNVPASNQVIPPVQQGQVGSIHTGQNYALPPSAGFDVQFSGQQVTTFGGANSFAFFGQPIGQSIDGLAFLLNGQAGQLTFQVTGFTPEQHPVVTPVFATHTSGHTNTNPPSFALQFPTQSAQLGSLLNVSPIGTPQIGFGALPIDQFSSLLIALKELQTINPAAAQALSVLTPSATAAPRQTGAAVLFLLSALKGGGLENWIGDGADKLTAKHKILQLLEQALKEGANPRLLSNTPTGDWRAFSIPMQLQDTTVPISLYVQDHQQQSQQQETEDEEEKIKMTRFVFEFDLTRMGEVQVDGLMRERNVDLFIRTHRDLSPDMKKTVKAVYQNALDRSNLTGDVAFQSDPKRWIQIKNQPE